MIAWSFFPALFLSGRLGILSTHSSALSKLNVRGK